MMSTDEILEGIRRLLQDTEGGSVFVVSTGATGDVVYSEAWNVDPDDVLLALLSFAHHALAEISADPHASPDQVACVAAAIAALKPLACVSPEETTH